MHHNSLVFPTLPPPPPTSSTMASDSTNDTPPIFKGRKLKWGTYKMQNVLTRTYLDIEEHSRALCSRPAQNLEEGNGIVRGFR